MKTTLELSAALFRKLEQAAAAHGTSPEEFIIRTLEKKLVEGTTAAQADRRARLPLIPSKQPGSLRLTNADIEELLA